MTTHTKKISRLINKERDVDEYIDNRSSYKLSFFEKLMLSRGLEIKANFEKAYWRLDPSLDENQKELATVTLRSIALNYMQRKGSTPPKTLLRAISRLRKQQDIVISRPDKGNGVIILDKSQYLELLKKSSVNLTDKFAPVSLERSKTRGRQ